jgi:predicted acyl esterase
MNGKYESWPPQNTVSETFYLGAKGKLTKNISESSEEFVQRPNKPVPYMGKLRNRYDERIYGCRPKILLQPDQSIGV